MNRSALVSLGIFGFLLLVYLVTHESQVSSGVRTLDLDALEADAVTSFEITGASSAYLARGESGWRVAEAKDSTRDFPADEAIVDRALQVLSALEVGTFVSGRAVRHAELEIDAEKGLALTVERSSGDPLAIVIGRASKSGGTLVRLQNADDVFVASQDLRGPFAHERDGWRRRAFVDLDPAQVTTLSVEAPERPGAAFAAATDESGAVIAGEWRATEGHALPAGYRIDAAAVAARIRALANLRASSFVDQDLGPSETGFSVPGSALPSALRVTARTLGGDDRVLLVGNASSSTADGEAGTYVKLESDPQIYRIPSAEADRLRGGLDSFRDLTLVSFDANEVTGLSFRHPSGSVALQRDAVGAGQWTLAQPVSPPADYVFSAARVGSQLAGLGRARATRMLGPEGEVAARFDAPVEVALSMSTGSETRLVFGSQVKDSQTGEVYAKPGDGFVYAVAAELRSRFETPLDLFRELPPPPGGPGPGPMGGGGLENLPPELRQQIEEAMRQQGMAAP